MNVMTTTRATHMTSNEKRLREFAECLGATDAEEPLEPCGVGECEHADCQLANAILAALDSGQATPRMLSAMCRAVFSDDKA